MKIKYLLAAVFAFSCSNVFADVYKCGLFLNRDQTPVTTATLDDATQDEIWLEFESYLGALQVVKQRNGEKALAISVLGKNKSVAVTALPMGFESPLILLAQGTEEYVAVRCAKGAMELVAPEYPKR